MRCFIYSVLVACVVVSAPLALAQTTGDIVGRVTDEQGGVLPGVTVEARGPAFQGVRSNVTDGGGVYRLVLLPPGVYKVTATLQGFARVESTITVALGMILGVALLDDLLFPRNTNRPGKDRLLAEMRKMLLYGTTRRDPSSALGLADQYPP